MILLSVLAATLRTSVPLLFAAMGGIFSERSGVVLIALEGFLLCGAFTGSVAASATGSTPLAWLIAGLATALFALLYAVFAIQFRVNQIVGGTAMNLLAMGVTPFMCNVLYGSTIATPTLPLEKALGPECAIVAGILIVGMHLAWKRLPAFLWLRFAGEHPEALENAGISVKKVRYVSILIAGFLTGLGGGTLSLYLSSSFTKNMSGGRGFMALAAVILGKWKPLPTLAACLFFSLSEALQILLQGVSLKGGEPIPVQWIQILPYVVSLIVVAGFVGSSRAPRALGTPV